MARPLLFAYGTLQEARQRDAVLRGAATREIGRGSVAGTLYDLGEYPGLVADGAARVPGTLIELPDEAALALLDAYEGVDEGLYARVRATVRLETGDELEAWLYSYLRPVDGRPRIASW